MKKSTKILSIGIVISVIGLYLALWTYSAQWFGREIDRLYAEASAEGIEFLGEKPVLGNFPFVPEIHYAKGLRMGNAELLFPTLSVRGYPLPGTSLKISFPSGVSLGGIADPAIWSLDFLEARLGVPYRLPRSLNAEDIAAWQRLGGKIDIRDYTFKKADLHSHGEGMFAFDAELQPAFFLDSTVHGYEEFIEEQKRRGLIESFPAAMAMAVLNGLSAVDEESGTRKITLSVSVKNRILTVGPLQVLELPRIVWDTRNWPGPHR